MAFGQKYQGETYSNNGKHYYVKIYQDGWTGATTDIDIAANGITIDYPAVDDVFAPIRGSAMTINAISSEDFFFEDFFDTEFGDFKAELYNVDTASIEWEGFITSEIYSENFEVAPYSVKLIFVDGLAELKNIPFPENSGLKHVIEVVRLCVNQINDLDINDCYDVFEDSHTSTLGNSPLVQTYVDSNTYTTLDNGIERAISCYDVLQHVLKSFACFIVQSEGMWWIVRARQLSQLSLYYKRFAASIGTEEATTVASHGSKSIALSIVDNSTFSFGTNIRHVGGTGTFTVDEKIKRIRYHYNPFKNGNGLLKNTEFLKGYGTNQYKLPAFWTDNNMDEVLTWITTNGKDYATYLIDENRYVVHFVDLDQNEPVANNEYIYQSAVNIYVDTNDKMLFTCDFEYKGDSENDVTGQCVVKFQIKLTDLTTATDYYFAMPDDGVLQWTTNSSVTPYISLSINERKGFTWGLSGVGTLPFTGKATLSVRIYKPYYPYENSAYCLWRGFQAVYYPSDNSSLDFEYIAELDNYKSTYEWEAFHGEGTNYAANGALRASDGSLLTTWGGSAQQIHEVVVDDLLSIKSALTKRIDLTLEGSLLPISRLLFTLNFPSATTNVYMNAIGMSWDVQNDFYTCNLAEVKEYAYTPVTEYLNDLLSQPFAEPITPPEPIKIKTTLTNGSTTDSGGSTTNFFA
jgi:hypothetical protein